MKPLSEQMLSALKLALEKEKNNEPYSPKDLGKSFYYLIERRLVHFARNKNNEYSWRISEEGFDVLHQLGIIKYKLTKP